MNKRDRSIDEELDRYITSRLLDFYDGLLERRQIGPPIQRPVSEDKLGKTNRYTADLAP